MTKTFLAQLLICSVILSSCSKLDDMGKNASKASENSGKAATAASESRDEIAHGRIITRAGGAKDARGKAFDRMRSRYTLQGKVVEAATYMKAFEYQLWTGQRYDEDTYLVSLLEDAVNELYRNISELNEGKSIDDTNPTSFRVSAKNKDRDMNIVAMSLALHKVHGLQITVEPIELEEGFSLLSGDDNQGLSTLEFIKNTLVKINQYEDLRAQNILIDTKSYFTSYEFAIYSKKSLFEALLNTRVNALLTLAVAELSNIDESKIEALSALFMPDFMDSVNNEFLTLNDAQKLDAIKYLNEAYKLKSFLDNNKLDGSIYKDIQKIFRKMRHPKNNEETLLQMNIMDKKMVDDYYRELNNLFIIKRNKVKGVK